MVYVEAEDEQPMDLSGKSTGDTALADYVRRKMQRIHGLELTRRNRRMVLQMRRNDGNDWTSPVNKFKVCYAGS